MSTVIISVCVPVTVITVLLTLIIWGRLDTLRSALDDAAAYRREYLDGWCGDCSANAGQTPDGQKPELCLDHATDEGLARGYDALRTLIAPAGRHQRIAKFRFRRPWFWNTGTHR
jgi:hypothetical protein